VSTCKYCGKDAGFLRGVHKECDSAHDLGMKQIVELIAEKATQDPSSTIKDAIATIAKSSFIDDQSLASLSIIGWQSAVSKALENGIFTLEQERALVAVKDQLALNEQLLDSNGSHSRLVKAGVIREVLEGKIPQRLRVEGNIPFNLQKNEQIVWIFKDAKYYEQRTSTRYQGSYSGVSMRVMKGVYFRTGGFRGNPVQTSSIVHADTGLLGLTNKHVYFAGPRKAFRIAYNKIVAFTPYNDGLGIQRDAQSAKPQIFVVDDGWFIHNLAVNLSELGKA
jgi:hypothetical protein